VLQLPGAQELAQTLKLEEGLRRSFAPAELTWTRLREFAAAKTTDPRSSAPFCGAPPNSCC
jgi:hypothetical protein